MSRISVIIPVYNCEKYIKTCIESVLRQTMEDLEIILVDDGSTDATADICRNYAKQDTRFVYLCQENQGVSAARNHGIEAAGAGYVMFVDADDAIDPSMCAAMFERMEKEGPQTNPHTDLVLCGFRRQFYQNGRLKSVKEVLPDCAEIENGRDLGEVFGRLYETTLLTSAWGKLYKKNLLDQMSSWFPKELGLGEDVLFNLEYLKQCQRIAVVNQPFYIYNHYGGKNSLTRKISGERIQIGGRLLVKAEDFAKGQGIYDQVKERLWKVYYKDCMNYLEQFPFGERLEKADVVFQSKELCRILTEETSGKTDMKVYRFFLGSGSRWMVCAFAGIRKLAKRILRGNGA